MKYLYIACSLILIGALFEVPYAYYIFLRYVVFASAIIVIVREIRKKRYFNFWTISFLLVAFLFNPIIRVHFEDWTIWKPLDIVAAVLFAIRAFNSKERSY